MGISLNWQLRCSWGQRGTDYILRSKVNVKVSTLRRSFSPICGMCGCIWIKVIIIIHNQHFGGPREGFNCNTFCKLHYGTYTVDTNVDSDCFAVISNHAVIKIYSNTSWWHWSDCWSVWSARKLYLVYFLQKYDTFINLAIEWLQCL